jgi:Mg-chelatase subunit ChlD
MAAILCVSSARAADVRRPVPTVVAACDVIDWVSAEIGRAKLPAEAAAADGLYVITGGVRAVGGADAKTAGAQTAALIDAAGVDVVNLAHRDLVAEPSALAPAAAKLVSASFTSQGQPAPWRSHAIIERGGKRVAVIGIATKSEFEPMAGLQYIEPREALTKALVEAGAVDAVVLLADAPLADVAALVKETPAVDAVIVSGRGGGAAAVEGLPLALRVPPGGRALGVRPADAAKPALAVALDRPAELSAAYVAAAKQFGFRPTPPALSKEAPAPQPLTPPTALATNGLAPHGVSAANRAAVATVRSAGVFDAFAGRAAPQGRKYLVLDVEFRNTLTPQMVRDRLVPVQYLIPKLSDHLYLVENGRRVLAPSESDAAGVFDPGGELNLPRAGMSVAGKLVYEIDAAAPPRELTLRLYDYAHGHFTLPVLAAVEPLPPQEPITRPLRNEVLELAVYDLKKSDELNGERAPAGMTFVSMDVRATSQFKFPADATGFNPDAKPGQKLQVGTVADWTDAHKYLQLVADGLYGYVPQPATTLSPAPRFLPDVMTGGRVVFVAPKDAKSLELRCDFPNARTPEAKVVRPRGITVALEGQQPLLANKRALARIDDGVFAVTITDQTSPPDIAGQAPEEGKRFVVLDVTVQNRNAEAGEFFQTAEQLKLADAAGNPTAIDEATFAGVYRPAPLVWIPVNDRRSFQVAYQLPDTETAPRLAYTGVSKAEIVALARLAPAAAAGAPAAAPAGAPNTKPDAQAAKTAPAAMPKAANIEVDGKRFPARVPVRPNLKAKGLAGVGLKPEQVNQAIDKGSAFLWNYIKTKDLGERREAFGSDHVHVLSALALVHSGAHKKFPDFDAQLRKLLGSYRVNAQHDTYQAGLFCMLVAAYGDPTFLPQMQQTARWLVENQGPEGSWAYGAPLDAKLFEPAGATKVLQVSGGRPLDGSDVAEPMKRVTPQDKVRDGDNSASQYAILGLHAASRWRMKSSTDLWQRALALHKARQTEEGSWPYTTGSGGYGSMTGAGICALALTRHELGSGEQTRDIDERIERGLAWLNANFSVGANPALGNRWVFYYLYSLERVGRILDTEFIGEHEWYPLGASALVGNQQPDGDWSGASEESDRRIATSFALLFLTRATETLAEPERSGPGTLTTAVALPPGRKLYVILDASGSMLEELDGRPKFDITRDALASLVKELPANTQVALRAYGYRKRAIEEGASEDSKLLVPMDKLQKDKLLELLGGIRARGKTPLAYSLEQARAELPAATADEPLTVLLLTDGGEDTQPRRDPVAAAAAYAKLPNVRLRIVGFDINRADWTEQLNAMAAASGGQYLPAANLDSLVRELRTAVFETPENFTVVDDSGKQVAAGKFGSAVELPAGKYRIRSTYAGQTFEEPLWINAGTGTAVTFNAVAVPSGTTAPSAPAPSAPGAPPAPASIRKFCTNCGTALAPGAKFCTRCGTPAPQ